MTATIKSYSEYKEYLKTECPYIYQECKSYYEKDEINEIYEMLCSFFYECYKRDLEVEFKFGEVYIKSKHYDQWKFTPCFGKITLMHKNPFPCKVGEYHTQFIQKISMKKLAIYIDEHDRAKYTSEFVHFSVS